MKWSFWHCWLFLCQKIIKLKGFQNYKKKIKILIFFLHFDILDNFMLSLIVICFYKKQFIVATQNKLKTKIETTILFLL